MRARAIAGLLALLPACGGEDSCDVAGIWDAEFTETSGDCGFGTWSQLVDLSATDQQDPACTGRRELVDNGCTLEISERCPISDPVTGANLGTATWTGSYSASGDQIDGAFDIDVVDDLGRCQARLSLSGTRQ